VFPTVYAPLASDKAYYDTILESDITPGAKVLVVGTGSGADAWVASLKSKTTVYVVDINPMAIANTMITARLGGFSVEAIAGDITAADLPDAFSEFDFVLWNMPFLKVDGDNSYGNDFRGITDADFHDGDDGTILKGFLERIPSLLKNDGTAILLNVTAAQEFIKFPDVIKRTDGRLTVFIIRNRAR
jgi:release factor glutamine methyltransferase